MPACLSRVLVLYLSDSRQATLHDGNPASIKKLRQLSFSVHEKHDLEMQFCQKYSSEFINFETYVAKRIFIYFIQICAPPNEVFSIVECGFGM